MKVDILYLTKNRLEFTRQSLAALMLNTNWELIRQVIIVDDGSVDGTEELCRKVCADLLWIGVYCILPKLPVGMAYGSPAAVMNNFLMASQAADVVCKIDSDVIVPPGCLDVCVNVMARRGDLDLLGIEPPASRVPHFEGMKRSPTPEFDPAKLCGGSLMEDGQFSYANGGYAQCDSIGGIGLMRTACFQKYGPLKPHSIYGGFTEWQLAHPQIRKGWIVPPLKVFLLDRLAHEPWAGLSRQYEAKGWQRAWGKYPAAAKDQLWGWWTPA